MPSTPSWPTTAGARPWAALEDAAARMSRTQFVSRVRLLGVPAATLLAPCGPPPPVTEAVTPAWTSRSLWPAIRTPRLEAAARRRPVVHVGRAAGGHDSGRAGAEVTKVESTTRPDGAREIEAFYRTLHPPGQPELLLDFTQDADRRRLRALARPSRRGHRVVEAPGTRATRSGADGCGTAPRARLGEHHRLRARGPGPGLGGLRRRRCRCRRARELGIN